MIKRRLSKAPSTKRALRAASTSRISEASSKAKTSAEAQTPITPDPPSPAETSTDAEAAAVVQALIAEETLAPGDPPAPVEAPVPAESALHVDQPEATPPRPASKTRLLVELLRRPGGSTIEVMMQATGWQAHSVRGALSGAVKKGMGLPVASQMSEGRRVYCLPTLGGDA